MLTPSPHAAPVASATEPTRTPAGRPLPVPYTLLQAVLLVAATGYGLLASHAYRLSSDIAAQGRGQDLLTLLTVPVLVWCSARARAGSLRAHLLWLGLLLYMTYTYITYAFSVPFNNMFLVYIAVLGLATYGLINGLLRIDVATVAPAFAATPRRTAAWALALTSSAFALVWLADILPALPGGLPQRRFAYDLPNPVYVLDLAWLIPLVLTTAVLLWRAHPAAPALAAVLLVKLLTLGLAILAMAAFMLAEGTGLDAAAAPIVTLAAILVVLASVLLTVGARRMRPVSAAWLRPSLWP